MTLALIFTAVIAIMAVRRLGRIALALEVLARIETAREDRKMILLQGGRR